MTDHQMSQQGLDASMVLENQAYQAAMQALRLQVVEQWRECPIRDVEGQRLLLQLAKLAEKFEGILSGMVQAGKFAQNKINLDNERNESAARKMLRRVM